ncbi:Hypothetical predicted protein [Olea europaea subsp. europaea]|uniref:Uncharacterized protein n=1 Tax=Olea europaea subsp. europaea TaxID=158383 RepID=A0A8S0TL24_OLEEU|nr:Hypothetical predicted protein [Olea europaea subsp. europaea]
MQSKEATIDKRDGINSEDASGIAHYNSDTDDWTFVSSASSGGSRGSSNSSSPERGNPPHQHSSPTDNDKTATTLCTSKQPNGSQPLQAIIEHQSDSTSSDQQLVTRNTKKHMGHHKRKMGSCERADDADDESDGMTEINLGDQGDEQQQHISAVSAPSPTALITAQRPVINTLDSEAINNLAVIDALHGPHCDARDEGKLQSIDEKNEDSARQHKRHLKCMNLTSENPAPTHRVMSTVTKTNVTRSMETNGSTQSTKSSFDFKGTIKRYKSNLLWLTEQLVDALLNFWGAIVFIVVLCGTLFLICSLIYFAVTGNKVPFPAGHFLKPMSSPVDHWTFDSVYSDPINHAHTELKLMDEEMIECVRRENPNRKDIELWDSMKLKELTKYEKLQTNVRPYKGLVCYEGEIEWRKRFNRLKSEFNLDFRKIIRQIKRKITNDALEKKHPAMKFRLILNQLEYLDHLDQSRKDRALEKLKAENLELMRRLNSSKKTSSSSGKNNKFHHTNDYQPEHRNNKYTKSAQSMSANSLISLESENVRLKHEIDVLKARLTEKAGPVYIRQSIELEKCERENNALKQFHHQVAQEVTKNLKQLDQAHSMDSLAIFENEHDDSLASRLATTQTSLFQLGEGITKMIARNNILESNIWETQSLNERILNETNDLIEDSNQTEVHGQDQQDKQEHQSDSDDSNRFSKSHIARDNMACAQQQLEIRKIKGDWMTKRAKLRERLRKVLMSPEPRDYSLNMEHSMPQVDARTPMQRLSQETYKKKRGGESREEHYPNEGRNFFKSSQTAANSYSQNSHKNCKDHFRRDEL